MRKNVQNLFSDCFKERKLCEYNKCTNTKTSDTTCIMNIAL